MTCCKYVSPLGYCNPVYCKPTCLLRDVCYVLFTVNTRVAFGVFWWICVHVYYKHVRPLLNERVLSAPPFPTGYSATFGLGSSYSASPSRLRCRQLSIGDMAGYMSGVSGSRVLIRITGCPLHRVGPYTFMWFMVPFLTLVVIMCTYHAAITTIAKKCFLYIVYCKQDPSLSCASAVRALPAGILSVHDPWHRSGGMVRCMSPLDVRSGRSCCINVVYAGSYSSGGWVSWCCYEPVLFFWVR